MQQGWVYVLVNSSMPGIAKVGRTARSPTDRVAELSQASGVATPFVLAFDQPFADCCAAEKAVHHELDRRGLRVAANREFFRGPPSDIIRVVLETADSCAPPRAAPASRSADQLLAAGDNCLHGTGNCLQDTAEAIRLYRLAATRGSLAAYERLGHAYAQGSGAAARRKALDAWKDGVRRGDAYCYGAMATLFAAERNVVNFTKAWELFFAACDVPSEADPEAGRLRFERACCRYIAGSLSLGLPPGYRDRIRGLADRLIRMLLTELDHLRRNAPARAPVVACLRWVHQSLLPERVAQPVCGTRAQPWWWLPGRQAGQRRPAFVPAVDAAEVALYNRLALQG